MSDISLSKAVRTNLLSLQNTATMMEKTQERLATGNKVNSALDNPSNFFTASALNSRAADMGNLLGSMASGIKVIEAANNGITALTKNLESMQSTLRQARQDKSFQTDTYEVGKDSTLKLSGGQFPEGFEVKLQEPNGGTAASVSFNAAYEDATASGDEGIGARALIEYDASFGLGDKLKINGQEITLGTPASADATGVAAAIATAMTTAGITGLTASASGNKIVLENTDRTAASPTVEFVSGVTAATFGETSFTYDAANVGAVKVGNQDISTGGGTFEAFVKSLQDNGKDGGYTVISDAATKKISLVSTTPGGAAPTITGLRENAPAGVNPAEAGTTTLGIANLNNLLTAGDLDIGGPILLGAATDGDGVAAAIETALGGGASVAYTAGAEIPAQNKTTVIDVADIATLVGSNALTINGGTAIDLSDVAITDGDDVADAIAAALGGGATVTWTAGGVADEGTLLIDYGAGETAADISVGGGLTGVALGATQPGTLATEAGSLVITYAEGERPADTAAIITAGTGVTFTSATVGSDQTPGTPAVADGISVTRTNGTAGAFVTTENAASHKFNVTYGDKSAAINIVGQDGSPYAKTNQLDLINDQLKAAGIVDVKASFDADDKLVFTANGPESKTLAISGKDVALFGTENVSTGTPAVSAYKSSSTVDRFVEEINRNPGTVGKVRASNDNGKLRIENLSTQALDVEFDKDGSGVGAPTQHEIKGNVIRDNLSKQFNDLRDQLDKFADDASFNGINLLRGDKLTITFNESGSSAMQIQAKDKNGNERPITAANLNLESLIGADLDDDADIDALLGKLSTALSELRSQASTFGSNLSAVQNRQDFTKSMINTLETGAANLTLADMNEEAANLLALQTRQSLSSSALSMASQQDQSVLQLLR
jgi:flagellin